MEHKYYTLQEAWYEIFNQFHKTRLTSNVSVNPDALYILLEYVKDQLEYENETYREINE